MVQIRRCGAPSKNVGKMGTPDSWLSQILIGGNAILCNIKYMILVYYEAFFVSVFCNNVVNLFGILEPRLPNLFVYCNQGSLNDCGLL